MHTMIAQGYRKVGNKTFRVDSGNASRHNSNNTLQVDSNNASKVGSENKPADLELRTQLQDNTW